MAKKSKFTPQQTAQNTYEAQLRKVAKHAAALVKAHINEEEPYKLDDTVGMMRAASLYSEALTPWAEITATQMFKTLDKHNAQAFRDYSQRMGTALRVELHETHSNIARSITNEQVELIKSIPLEAATRAQGYAYEAAQDGTRADYVAKQIMGTTEVTQSRATLIARTEIAKANSAINQSRSQALGLNQYIWSTAKDDRVRESHAALEGNVYSWDSPPEVGDEGAFNPGEIYNCRCYATPVINVSEI